MKQKTLVLCKGDIAEIPPVMTYILALLDLGHEVVFITGSLNKSTEEFLKIRPKSKLEIINLKIEKKSSKLRQWYSFRKAVHCYLTENCFDTIWISTFDTALCIWNSKLKTHNAKLIISVLELYDNASFIYKKALSIILPKMDKIVVPEYNRACVFRTWYKLSETPLVIPNKPFEINNQQIKNTDVDLLHNKLDALAKGRKILLYQGGITKNRNLDNFAYASKILEDSVVFVLMGKDSGYLKDLYKINNDIVHIPYIPSPFHLNITSKCDIGIVTYDFINLNNIYCAPNKIWEYSAFGKPMIGNKIPGLEYTINQSNSGICVNTQDVNQIVNSLQKIIMGYDKYSQKSFEFFDSVDLTREFSAMFKSF